MMKLIKTQICNAKSLSTDIREQFIIPNTYNGRIILETWDINGAVRYKGVVLNSGIRNYLLSLGDFKSEKEVKPDIKLDYMRKKRIINMWNKFKIITQEAVVNIESADDEDILRLELEITGHGVNIKTAVVNTPNEWLEEAFGDNKSTQQPINDDFVKPKNSLNDIKTRGEELKSLFDITLDVMSDTTREGITKTTINNMGKLQHKMEEYNKKYPPKTDNTQNILNEAKNIIQKMKNDEQTY